MDYYSEDQGKLFGTKLQISLICCTVYDDKDFLSDNGIMADNGLSGFASNRMQSRAFSISVIGLRAVIVRPSHLVYIQMEMIACAFCQSIVVNTGRFTADQVCIQSLVQGFDYVPCIFSANHFLVCCMCMYVTCIQPDIISILPASYFIM